MKLILEAILFICCLGFSQSDVLRESSKRTKRQLATNSSDKRIVCYYTNWSPGRSGDSKFGPEDIHPHLCTHVLYAFADLDSKSGGLQPFDVNQDIQQNGYSKFVELKKENPALKAILSVGGSREGSPRFSSLAADPQKRQKFATESLSYLKQFQFDGLDIVWQYPNDAEDSSVLDKENYVRLVQDLREAFKQDYIISMTVPIITSLIDRGYNLPELSKYVDFMNIVTYNYHTATEPTVGHVAPLYATPQDLDKDLNIDTTITAYTSRGVDPSKLNMGIPLYGISFILEDPAETDFGAAADQQGTGNQEPGSVFYNTFCKKIKDESWTVVHVNRSAVGPYAYKDNQWVAYDDEDMIRTKARYAIDKKLGGLMFWSIDLDDFKGICHSRAFPLIKAAREVLLSKRSNSTSIRPKPTVATPRTTKPDRTMTTPTTATPRSTMPSRTVTRAPPPTRPNTNQASLTQTTAAPIINTNIDNEENNFPIPTGNRTFISNRDIVFQNVKIWISNHYYAPP